MGIERAIEYTNRNCLNRDPTGNLEYQLGAIEGVDKCLFGLRGDRQRYAFKWGRKDCQSDTSVTKVPYPFVAHKKEKHANAYGTGQAALNALKEDFGLSPKESMSLMATHGLANFGANTEHLAKYNWIGGSQKARAEGKPIRSSPGSFSNMYFKILKGQFYRSRMGQEYDNGVMIGDVDGNPVNGAGWGVKCFAVAKREKDAESRSKVNYHGGPCNFHVTKPGD